MAGKYSPYPEYKNSGSLLLGDVPAHWQLARVKHVAELTPKKPLVDRNLSCSFIPMEKLKTDSIILDETKQIDAVYDGYTYFADGDILMAKVTPCFENKNIAIAKGLKNKIGFGSSEIYTIRASKKVDSRFLFYRLQEDGFMEMAIGAMTGAGGLKRVPSETVANCTYASPEDEEQEKIANFLDYETAKIDTLIEKQQQLIKLLKEKRQAVISHAVTKGLNPNAPMRDSGVEWLGEVPEHWEHIKLKHITKEIIDAEHKTAEYFDGGEFLVCRTTNVRDGQLRLEGGKFTNLETYSEWTRRGVPEAGDILFTREAPAGEACVYSGGIPLCLGQRMVLFKLKTERVEPNFVLHSIYSGLSDDFVKQLSQGSTVAHFNMADIQNIPLFEPPVDEQITINEYLDKVLSKYDGLIRSAEEAINLMQERRTALISAAVTGKIDVRNWQAPEPSGNQNKEVAA